MSLLQKLSWECSHTQIPINIPGRVKTRYTANLNPFRPFTLVNKKTYRTKCVDRNRLQPLNFKGWGRFNLF